ncbi:MAG: N-acetyl-gamma-glutamyl-phosphate reductase [Clostridia bacterium]|nr:N-acetyl-gamma-glutamyl-phosphate reductase [Erysipelotrichia bacterium]NCC87919.1 N-acetyl-gamma-glutamyl-phosphate reductase [Clostridia bacterium]
MDKLKVGIIGASGYAGAELVRLLLQHPKVEIVGVNARSYLGKPIASLYSGLQNITTLIFEEENTVIAKSELIFASLPHGLSEKIAKKCISKNKKFIDLGADFRLHEEEDYQTWYHLSYQEKSLHALSVYGLSELHRENIKKASIIANPGCYPTAISLGAYPALQANLVHTKHIIIDAKSGTTGAGKELSETTHFPRTNEAFAPYKVAQHRHTPEIEQMLSEIAKQKTMVTFVPHLLPINRGIVATMYLSLKEQSDLQAIHALYTQAYATEKFVRVLPLGKTADLKFVKYSNYCDISLHLDKRTNTLIIVSCIDNMVKGAAGQAIQNMNLMYDFKEDCGLSYIAPSF